MSERDLSVMWEVGGDTETFQYIACSNIYKFSVYFLMANGFYHGNNVLKYHILRLLFDVYKNPEIPMPGWVDGVYLCKTLVYDNQATLTNALARYRKCGFIARSRKRNAIREHRNHSYRWRITKKG